MKKNRTQRKVSRRQFLKTTALATGALATGAPFIRTTYAAGKVTLGIWDHWVPGANDVMTQLCKEWGDKNRVQVEIDYITSIGFKDLLTASAEARAKVGHDIISLPTWQTTIHRDSLESMDDVMGYLEKKYGEFTPDAAYLFKHDGVWRSVPAPAGGNHSYPMVSRLDYFKRYAGVDLRKMFPAGPNRDASMVAEWNYDNFLVHAEKLHKAGHPFGNQIGPTSDAQDWLCPLFLSFGAQPADKDGNITINSDGTRAALEYMKKLTQFMPPEVYAWDDASNNRWIISGKGSAIQNPPSAWTVAKRDRPEVAAQLWHHDTPRGPKGHYRGTLPRANGVWKFAENKQAAKDLLQHMLEREQMFKLITASQGYDIPMIKAYFDHPIWTEIGPPKGGQYNYPIRGDEVTMTGGFPAPTDIAANIYTKALVPNLVARVTQGGQSFDEAIKWAENELEGYMRG